MTIDQIYRDTFNIGDKVTWRDERWAKHNDGERRYGSGPFTVMDVQIVADYEVSGVGHTQVIRMKELFGTFSGAYFKKVEENRG